MPKILTGHRLVPAVVGTSGHTGPWDKAGSVRQVHLADGTKAREQVTAFERPGFFSYRVSHFTFAVRHLAEFATGEWWFEAEGAGTRVRWTYTFHAKGRASAAVLALFARTQWLGYMRVCLDNTRRLAVLEKPSAEPAHS